MKMLWLAIVMLTASVSALAAGSGFFQSSFGDYQSELRAAKQAGKTGVMLFFEQDGCPFCKRMEETVFNQPDVQAYFHKHFLIYAVDIRGDVPIKDFQGKPTTEKDFAFAYRVRATPVMAFFDPTGKLMYRYTGATRDKAEFLALGRYIVSGAYRTQPFETYEKGVE